MMVVKENENDDKTDRCLNKGGDCERGIGAI